ncbi:unnamed protein product [Symbiodinium sp. CCMP2592]|nr:unnamed protein product [Symbiodinium sp. CCMP2592]
MLPRSFRAAAHSCISTRDETSALLERFGHHAVQRRRSSVLSNDWRTPRSMYRLPTTSTTNTTSTYPELLQSTGHGSWNLAEYTKAISSSSKAKKWRLALCLFLGMATARLQPNVISYNVTISALEKGQQWQLALSVLDCMPKAKVAADLISYNATISSCEKGSRWQLALAFFYDLPKNRLLADVVSYNATISSCEKSGHWQLALLLFRRAEGQVEPDATTYNATILGFGVPYFNIFS